MRSVAFIAAAAALVSVLAACGGASPNVESEKTVRIILGHLRFAPDSFSVAAGTTVNFVLVNGDPTDHEFVVGTEEVQKEHARAAAFAGDHAAHDPNRAAVPAGETVEFTYTFDQPGTVIYGCHVDGHYAQGMRGTIEVTA